MLPAGQSCQLAFVFIFVSLRPQNRIGANQSSSNREKRNLPGIVGPLFYTFLFVSTVNSVVCFVYKEGKITKLVPRKDTNKDAWRRGGSIARPKSSRVMKPGSISFDRNSLFLLCPLRNPRRPRKVACPLRRLFRRGRSCWRQRPASLRWEPSEPIPSHYH